MASNSKKKYSKIKTEKGENFQSRPEYLYSAIGSGSLT